MISQRVIKGLWTFNGIRNITSIKCLIRTQISRLIVLLTVIIPMVIIVNVQLLWPDTNVLYIFSSYEANGPSYFDYSHILVSLLDHTKWSSCLREVNNNEEKNVHRCWLHWQSQRHGRWLLNSNSGVIVCDIYLSFCLNLKNNNENEMKCMVKKVQKHFV